MQKRFDELSDDERFKMFKEAMNNFGQMATHFDPAADSGDHGFWVHVDLGTPPQSGWRCRHAWKTNPLAVCTECDGHAPHVYDLTACGVTTKYHECEECGHLQNKFTLNQQKEQRNG